MPVLASLYLIGGNVIEKIQNKFKEIKNIQWITEENHQFLRIEIDEPSLEKISIISKEISKYIDSIDNKNKEYFLDIHSSGTEKKIEPENIERYINANIKITLSNPIKDKFEFTGTLLESEDAYLIIKWNSKGQFRKQKINIEDIASINEWAIIKKEK